MKLKIIEFKTGKQSEPTLTVYKTYLANFNKEAISKYGFPHGLRFKAGVYKGDIYLVPTDDKQYSQRLNVGLAGVGNLSNRDWNEAIGLKKSTKYDIEMVKDSDGVFYKLTPRT